MTEEAFDRIVDTLRPDGTGDPTDPSGAGYLTRGPMGSGTNGRALFVFDPDGNEAEINTRYLCKMMVLSRSDCDRACRLANQQRYRHFRPAGVGRGRRRALSVRKPVVLFCFCTIAMPKRRCKHMYRPMTSLARGVYLLGLAASSLTVGAEGCVLEQTCRRQLNRVQ